MSKITSPDSDQVVISSVTPNYRHIKATGGVLPMRDYHRVIGRDGGYTRVPANKDFSPRYDLFDRDLSVNSEANAIATRRYYSSLDGLDLQLAVSVAEAPKTFALMADTIKRLFLLFKAIKRGDWSSIGAALGGLPDKNTLAKVNRLAKMTGKGRSTVKTKTKLAADLFLEYKYGWRPLLSDVENSVIALNTAWEANHTDLVVRGSGSYSDVSEGDYFFARESSSVRITDYYKVLNPSLRNANSLGLTNLAEVAWELIPYSFVFDWFFPVGEWIAAQSALTGLQFDRGVYSYKDSVFKSRNTFTGAHTSITIPYPYEQFQTGRSDSNGPPSTVPILFSKQLDSAFNFDKVLTSLALVVSGKGS